MSAQTDFKISFRVVNFVPSNGFFRVIIPSDQAMAPTSGPVCMIDISMVPVRCQVVYSTSGQVWVDVAQTCTNGCNPGTFVQILF